MRSSRDSGFTMIEVLVAMAIAALLVAVAVPNLRPQVAQVSARSLAGDMSDGLHFARQYALNTSGVVTFTPNGCGYTITDSSSNTLKTASSTAPSGVTCTPLSNALTFLGDGSVSQCTVSGTGTTCSALQGTLPAKVTSANQTWVISVSPGGIVSTSAP